MGDDVKTLPHIEDKFKLGRLGFDLDDRELPEN
jgi:hypothetical protein